MKFISNNLYKNTISNNYKNNTKSKKFEILLKISINLTFFINLLWILKILNEI